MCSLAWELSACKGLAIVSPEGVSCSENSSNEDTEVGTPSYELVLIVSFSNLTSLVLSLDMIRTDFVVYTDVYNGADGLSILVFYNMIFFFMFFFSLFVFIIYTIDGELLSEEMKREKVIITLMNGTFWNLNPHFRFIHNFIKRTC